MLLFLNHVIFFVNHVIFFLNHVIFFFSFKNNYFDHVPFIGSSKVKLGPETPITKRLTNPGGGGGPGAKPHSPPPPPPYSDHVF